MSLGSNLVLQFSLNNGEWSLSVNHQAVQLPLFFCALQVVLSFHPALWFLFCKVSLPKEILNVFSFSSVLCWFLPC